MANNFPEWRKKHPGGSFDDYLHSVCVTESEIVETPVVVKSNRKGWKYLAVSAIAFAIFYAVGNLAGEAIVKFFRSAGSHKDLMKTEWTREPYGIFGLSLESPVKLIKTDLPMPDNVMQYIDRMDTYTYETANNFTILINSIKYKMEIGKMNLDGAATGSVNEMKLQPGVTDFEYLQDPFSVSDLPGFMQHGTFKKDGTGVEFLNSGILNGFVFYQVLVMWKADDKDSKSAAQRVLASIEIDNSKKENI